MVKVSDKNCAHRTNGRFDQTEKRWVQKFIMKEKKMGIKCMVEVENAYKMMGVE